LEDGSFWQYNYDDRDELTSAQCKWAYFTTTTPVAGQQITTISATGIGRNLAGDTNGNSL
jgi:hypothetical protein